MVGCDMNPTTITPSGERAQVPTVCGDSSMCWSHNYYAQSLIENIVSNMPDVDFVLIKLLHAINNLHQQLHQQEFPHSREFTRLLGLHTNYCHNLLLDLKNHLSTDQTLEMWRRNQSHMIQLFDQMQSEHLCDLWQHHCDLITRCFHCRVMRDISQEQQCWQDNQVVAQYLGAAFAHLL
jgi:hypothetical protein